MSANSNPIESKDFTEVAAAVATPVAGEAVAADAPVPTDKYLTPADVEASKNAPAAAVATPGEPPAASAAQPDAAATKGEPPKEKWDTILANAREKAKAEAKAATENEYAWAKDLNRDDVEATRKWIDLGNQNPLLALDQLVQGMIKVNPAQKAQIEHYFKSILQTAGPAAAAAAAADAVSKGATATGDDPMPEADVPTDTSNGVGVVYSKTQMKAYDEWKDRQFKKQLDAAKAELRGEIAPVLSERKEAETQKAIDEYTERSVGAISSRPGYEEFRAEIAAVYAAYPMNDGRNEGEKLRDAYLEVMSSKITEQTEAATKKASDEAIASIHRRADAGTVNPAAASASQPFDYKKATWEQALRHEFNSAALGR